MTDVRAAINWDNVRNILVVRDDRLGDMALFLVVIQNLARRLPDKRIDLLCSPANAALIESDPAIDGCFVINNGALTEDAKSFLESHRPDVVVYYQSYANFSNLAISLRAINPHAVFCSMVKDDGEGRHFTATFVHHGTGSMYERNIGYAAWLLGIDSSSIQRPEVHVDQRVLKDVRGKLKSRFPAAQPLVHINLSGGNYKSYLRHLRRNLSAANYVRAIDGIKHRNPNINFVITAAPEDAGMGERISNDLGRDVFFYRDTSVPELVSLMKSSSIVITPETAVSHIASALNKRLVALFFAERQMLGWRPFSDQYRCVTPGFFPLVWTIDGGRVADAALELLKPVTSKRQQVLH